MGIRVFTDYKPEATWEKLVLRKASNGDEEISCELLIKRPDFAEQVAAQADEQILLYLLQGDSQATTGTAALAHQRAKFNRVIIDWRGVSDGVNDIPYSLGMLEMMCSQYPQLLDAVNAIVNNVLITYPGDLEKNLPLPPVAGGMETTTETIDSTDSSISGVG